MLRFFGFSLAISLALGFAVSLASGEPGLSSARALGATFGGCLTILAAGLIFGGVARWIKRHSDDAAAGYFSALVSMIIVAAMSYVGAIN